MELKTKRLRIVPLSIERMGLLTKGQAKLEEAMGLKPSGVESDHHILMAYNEMYNNCLKHPKKFYWYTDWQIILKDENKSIGSIGFLGVPNKTYGVEIGYGINEEYRNCGYASEALNKMCEWAFNRCKINYIRAVTEPSNEASRRLLIKNKFKEVAQTEDGVIFERERPQTYWIIVYMCLGVGMSLPICITLADFVLGFGFGIILGGAIGCLLDKQDKRNRRRKEHTE